MGFYYVVLTYGFMSSLGVGLAYVAPLAAGMKVRHVLLQSYLRDLFFSVIVVPKTKRFGQRLYGCRIRSWFSHFHTRTDGLPESIEFVAWHGWLFLRWSSALSSSLSFCTSFRTLPDHSTHRLLSHIHSTKATKWNYLWWRPFPSCSLSVWARGDHFWISDWQFAKWPSRWLQQLRWPRHESTSTTPNGSTLSTGNSN